MDRKPRNLGRAYLIGELRRRGLSRRGAKRILNFILEEMKQALGRDEAVEFPFGWLERIYKISRHWELIGDEPMQPYTVEHFTDKEGVALLGGLDNMPDEPGCSSYMMSKAQTPPRRPRGRPRALDGDQVRRLLAMVSGPPPAGRARWTIPLIAGQVAGRKLAPQVSRETMRTLLRKRALKPWRGKDQCIAEWAGEPAGPDAPRRLKRWSAQPRGTGPFRAIIQSPYSNRQL